MEGESQGEKASEIFKERVDAEAGRLGVSGKDRDPSNLETEITSLEQVIDTRQGFAVGQGKDPEKREETVIAEAATIFLGKHSSETDPRIKALAVKALQERGFDPYGVIGDDLSVAQLISKMKSNRSLETQKKQE